MVDLPDFSWDLYSLDTCSCQNHLAARGICEVSRCCVHCVSLIILDLGIPYVYVYQVLLLNLI